MTARLPDDSADGGQIVRIVLVRVASGRYPGVPTGLALLARLLGFAVRLRLANDLQTPCDYGERAASRGACGRGLCLLSFLSLAGLLGFPPHLFGLANRLGLSRFLRATGFLGPARLLGSLGLFSFARLLGATSFLACGPPRRALLAKLLQLAGLLSLARFFGPPGLFSLTRLLRATGLLGFAGLFGLARGLDPPRNLF